MKKQFFLAIIIASLIIALFPSVGKAQEEERVIVLFKDNTDEASNETVIEDADGEVSQEIESIPAVAATIPSESIEELEQNPDVISVEKDIMVKINGQMTDWGTARTNAPMAWYSDLSGKGIRISVLDTGIAAHEDLKISGGTSFTTYTSSYKDDNGHGTFVAGVIGAKNNGFGTVGVAPEAELYAVKVLDNNGIGYLSDIIAGIDWSIHNNMDIINLSLGTDVNSPLLKEIVDKAYQEDILVVAAAGNNGYANGTGDTVNYPAKYASVIAVAAADRDNFRALFSVTGPSVELTAPGVDVQSTALNHTYTFMSGTSMAAPFVAGNLALAKQLHPSWDAVELRTYLQSNAVDLGTVGRDNWYGFGLVQAPKAQVSPQRNLTGITLKSPVYVYGSNGDVLKSYAQGTVIKYKTYSKSWNQARVKVNGNIVTAYIKKRDLENIAASPVYIKGIGLKSPTRIYSKASIGSKVLKSYKQGSVLKYRPFTSGWYEVMVKLNGKYVIGYINKRDVEQTASSSVQIKGIGLKSPTKIYSKASTGSKVLKSYSQGSVLKYRPFTTGWNKVTVKLNGKYVVGYINKRDVEQTASSSVQIKGIGLKSPTKIYSKASTGSKVLKSYKQASVLKYRPFTSGWYEVTVKLNGKYVIGYIDKRDVRQKK